MSRHRRAGAGRGTRPLGADPRARPRRGLCTPGLAVRVRAPAGGDTDRRRDGDRGPTRLPGTAHERGDHGHRPPLGRPRRPRNRGGGRDGAPWPARQGDDGPACPTGTVRGDRRGTRRERASPDRVPPELRRPHPVRRDAPVRGLLYRGVSAGGPRPGRRPRGGSPAHPRQRDTPGERDRPGGDRDGEHPLARRGWPHRRGRRARTRGLDGRPRATTARRDWHPRCSLPIDERQTRQRYRTGR